jgi:hypothetical protein
VYGGQRITVKGTWFGRGNTTRSVTVGGFPCEGLAGASDTQLSCNTTMGDLVGGAAVVVTSGGRTGSKDQLQYTYEGGLSLPS